MEAVELALVPCALIALTTNAYGVPLVNPVTTVVVTDAEVVVLPPAGTDMT
jgi:hypothetical protein